MSYNIDFKNPDVIRHVFMITFRNEKILFFNVAKKSIMEYLPFGLEKKFVFYWFMCRYLFCRLVGIRIMYIIDTITA